MGGKLATRVSCDMPVAQLVAGLGCAVGAELTPTLSSGSSSPVLGRNMVFQSLLTFTGHVSLPADFCYAGNWFGAQLAVCAST